MAVAGRALFLFSTLLAGACAQQGPQPHGQATGATLVGRVRLAPGARLPSYASDDLLRRELIAAAGDRPTPDRDCERAHAAARSPVQLGEARGLHGVVVGASEFTRYRARAPRVHTVRIEGCRLRPSLVSAMAGDRLVVLNADARTHAPALGPTHRAESLEPGGRRSRELRAGVESLLCTLAAPCGRTDILTFHHPLHATTDADGRFRIEDFPVGELVKISAWHPLFREASTQVWLERGHEKRVELVLRPR